MANPTEALARQVKLSPIVPFKGTDYDHAQELLEAFKDAFLSGGFWPELPGEEGKVVNYQYYYGNVKRYGAVGDHISNNAVADTLAFKRARDFVLSANATLLDTSPGNLEYYSPMFHVFVPNGLYQINEDKAFLDASLLTFDESVQGHSILGESKAGVRIWFNVNIVGTGGVLIDNALQPSLEESVTRMRVANMTIISRVPNNDLMRSYSEGAVRDIRFENVEARGLWRYWMRLNGTDTNSEMSWFNCNMAISANAAYPTTVSPAWLYIGSAITETTSIQFLNYWWINCHMTGPVPWIEAYNGGHFRLVNCDASVRRNTEVTPPPGIGNTLFKLNTTVLYNNTPGNPGDPPNTPDSAQPNINRGIASFSCTGFRCELSSPDLKLLESNWNAGQISFRDCDLGTGTPSAPFDAGRDDSENCIFEFYDWRHTPIIEFDNCAILGKHRYEIVQRAAPGYVTGVTSLIPKRGFGITYRNCRFLRQNSPHDFIKYYVNGAFQDRTVYSTDFHYLPPIRFEHCIVESNSHAETQGATWNCVVNGIRVRTAAPMEERYITLQEPEGLGSSTKSDIDNYVPDDVHLTRLRVWVDGPDATYTNGGTYRHQLIDGRGTVIAVVDIPMVGPYKADIDLNNHYIHRQPLALLDTYEAEANRVSFNYIGGPGVGSDTTLRRLNARVFLGYIG